MSDLDRCLDAMARDGLDALVLGREANARAVAGTRRLWLAGTRAFSPSCVVVRAAEAVHVLANSDDAVPDGFPIERLYGITWNPERLLVALQAIPAFRASRRVGVDGMTPLMHSVLTRAAPDATFEDAAPVMSALWRDRTVDEVEDVRAAAEVAREGLRAIVAELRPGVRARTLRGICANRFAQMDVTTPAFEAVVAPLELGGSTWLPPERLLAEGETVVVRGGALRDGWEASLARSYVVGQPPRAVPLPDRWVEIARSCRAGIRAGELRQMGAIVYGAGRGVEPWDDDFVLTPGVLVALEVESKADAETPARLRQDILLVTDDEPEQIT